MTITAIYAIVYTTKQKGVVKAMRVWHEKAIDGIIYHCSNISFSFNPREMAKSLFLYNRDVLLKHHGIPFSVSTPAMMDENNYSMPSYNEVVCHIVYNWEE